MVVEHSPALKRPLQGLHHRPAAGALSIKPKTLGEAIKSVNDGVVAEAEFAAPDDGSNREGKLAGERFRVNHQPRLTLRAQDVAGVEVLVYEHLGTLG